MRAAGRFVLRRLLRRKIGIPEMTILALLVIYAGLIEPKWVQVTRTEIEIAGLPEQFDGFRIVQVSDTHLSGPGRSLPALHRRVARMVNQLSPDLIAVTGDLVSNSAGGRLARDFLSRLQSRHGTYVIWGNWDTPLIGTQDFAEENLRAQGIRLLQNEAEPITLEGASIWLLGVLFSEPAAGETEEALLDAVGKGYQEETTILLAHTPAVWKEAEEKGIDLILSGHTHGGQVWIPLVTRLSWTRHPFPPVYRGFRDLGETKIYINRGIGTSVIPFRFLSRPEITVITLRQAA